MDFKILFSDEALSDLGDIIEYVAKDNADAACRVGESLIDHVKMLQSFPYAGVRSPNRKEVRKLFHTPYRVYYRVHQERKVVEVLHFWHAARLGPLRRR